MDKKIIIILTILLSGCANANREVACTLKNGNDLKTVTIRSHFDEILSYSVKESFYIPYEYLANPRIEEDIRKQIKGVYTFEDNYLVRYLEAQIDKTYSLSKTMEFLGDEGYVCR